MSKARAQEHNSRSLRNLSNKSGIILIVVLWVLVILTMLAISLGRKTNIELALTKYSISKSRAKLLAWSGMNYAISKIKEDTKNSDSGNKDSFYFCAIRTDLDVSMEELFKDRMLEDGHFSISYEQIDDDAEEDIFTTEIGETYTGNRDVTMYKQVGRTFVRKKYYGISDEERKININALTASNANILRHLILLLGFEEETANIISASVVDWVDADDKMISDIGAENEYYLSLEKPYKCKNTFFDTKFELLMVRGMTKEIFNALSDFITVFPKGRKALKINIDTATKPVLRAVARAIADKSPTSEESDADSLVEKIFEYVSGDDGVVYTEDDRFVDFKEMPLNAIERNISLGMNRARTRKSNYLNVKVQGVDAVRNISSTIEAIVYRTDNSIVSFKRF